MTLRFPVAPMKATLGTLPTDDEGWAFEIKYDGYRTLAFADGGRTKWQSSNLIDVTAKYPELSEFGASVNATSAIIDGELVVLDADGRPRFELMQQHATQVAFYAFDVLSVERSVTSRNSFGGTAPKNVRTQAKKWLAKLGEKAE